ncbi:hypothetical protein ANN_03986 [Periplaneta americana]|uniref:DUF4817 domain-containing protein n=1 Tax=Periplaneta americana TaxID=6978 RepID=A0ABQ8T967_PERAM|nr:hypothetical protein ANN_03986 [Periplaneta americana]
MIPGPNTESYPAFARIGLRENPGKNLNQVTCPDRDSNPGHLVSQPDALTVTPQSEHRRISNFIMLDKLEPNTALVIHDVVLDGQGIVAPHEYADIVYVYGLCDGSSLLAVAEYERRFPNRRVPYRRVFTVYGVG